MRPDPMSSFEQFLLDFATAVEHAAAGEIVEGYDLLLEAEHSADRGSAESRPDQLAIAYRYETARRVYAQLYTTDGEAPAGHKSSSPRNVWRR